MLQDIRQFAYRIRKRLHKISDFVWNLEDKIFIPLNV